MSAHQKSQQSQHSQQFKSTQYSQLQQKEYEDVKICDLDITKLKISEPKQSKNYPGVQNGYLTYNNKKLYLKLNELMPSPFGASSYSGTEEGEGTNTQNQGNSKKKNYTVQFSFPNTEWGAEALAKFQELDNCIIQQVASSQTLSAKYADKQNISAESIREFKYKSTVKEVIDKNTKLPNPGYPKYVRAKIITDFNDSSIIKTKIYDENAELLNASADPASGSNYIQNVIPQRSQCRAVLTPSVWKTVAGFGVTWSIDQIRVFRPAGEPTGCMLDDPVEGESEENACVEVSNQEADSISISVEGATGDDGDAGDSGAPVGSDDVDGADGGDVVEEPEPEPVPVPTPVVKPTPVAAVVRPVAPKTVVLPKKAPTK